MMKALILEEKGKAPVFGSVPVPEPGPGSVRIRLHAAALNHRDVWIMKGMYAGLKYPIIPGSDGAGIVDAVGPDTDGQLVGTEVVINPGHQWGADERFQGKTFEVLGLPENGTFAEYLCVPATYVFPKPAHLGFQEAAALPLAGVTAWRALCTQGRAKQGEKLLVTGAGGGVAQFGIQFGLALGMEVWVTSGSGEKLTAVQAMGASGGVNYKEEKWDKALKQQAGAFDVILDGAGGPGFRQLVGLAAPGGRIVVYGGTRGNWDGVSPQKVFWKQLSIIGSTMGSPLDFVTMLSFVQDHQLVPGIDKIFPLSEGQDAFDRMETGAQLGKIVLETL